jgi:bile acid-coenzyme A ligase
MTADAGICDRLVSLTGEAPDRPALTVGQVSVNRSQLILGTRRLVARMADAGVREDSVVAIALPNSVEAVQSVLATWWLGATPQLISHRLPGAELSAIVTLAEPALTIGISEADAPGRATLTLDDVGATVNGGVASSMAPAISSHWKAMTTGGSTGRPKIIVADTPATVGAIAGSVAVLRIPSEGTVLVPAPVSHNAPFTATVAGLVQGNHVVLMPRFEPREWIRLVEAHSVNWAYLVPTMMSRVWKLVEPERVRPDLSSLEVLFHMAAPCPDWLKRRWIDWIGPETLLEMYGGTEAQSVTVATGTEWLAHPGTVGRPIVGEMEIRDEDGARVPPDVTGEVWMRRGADEPAPYRYVGAVARTAPDGWESLGDIGRLDADGYLYITDRQSDMFLVGGVNVYPAEIEAVLEEHGAIRSSCVIGLPHEDLGSVPHALVEVSTPVSDDDLQTYLRSRLAPYKIPRSIERVDHALRDDAGKVRRSALRAARLTARSIRYS